MSESNGKMRTNEPGDPQQHTAAPKLVVGFVLFDPRPGEYLRLDRRKGWTWGESALRAYVFASYEEADAAKVIYGTDRPNAFVHQVTSTGPSPNAPGV